MNLMAPSQQPNGPSSFEYSPPSNLDTYDFLHFLPLPPPSRDTQSFDHPHSSRSMPIAGRYKKDMKQMTGSGMTGDEFDALPVAVRRKYFSTLERLRFAQNSRPDTANDRPRQRLRKGSLADRRGLDLPPLEPRRKGSRPHRKSARRHSVSSSDASWFMTLPEKIRQRQFTVEEQELLSGRLHENYILDAADEAIYKASRGASRNLTTPSNVNRPTTPSPTRDSQDSRRGGGKPPMADLVYESFRWMDEEEDLDLKLVLDDYHANLDGAVIPTVDSTRRPSFRRRLSITSMPFNRRSPSIQSPSPRAHKFDTSTHIRQRSRALSLMTPKHEPKASVSSIDPAATHYQDPEARLKLRVYLASPQKFDEAIEFGFPSIDGLAEDKENKPPRLSGDIIGRKSHSTEKSRSFFWKDVDMSSLFEDDSSMADPESPLTPMFADPLFKYQGRPSLSKREGKTSSDFSHLGITKPVLVKQPEAYTQAMAGSREMTLRMTLTRPDLRADDNTIYGWQTGRSPLREEPLTLDKTDEKAEVRGPFGGIDGWGIDEKENGVVKRIWNKVRSSQRKTN